VECNSLKYRYHLPYLSVVSVETFLMFLFVFGTTPVSTDV